MSHSLIATEGSTPAGTGATWHEISVRDFFSKVAWSGEENTPLLAVPEGASSGTLDMLVSVHEFFERFPWDGPLDVAAPLAPLTLQPDSPTLVDDLTLDSFADLF
ncbi:MAG: hypothetical protein AAFQ89_04420 [Cyanobacteria bacterium J06626_18]